jgi:hypothetical protein
MEALREKRVTYLRAGAPKVLDESHNGMLRIARSARAFNLDNTLLVWRQRCSSVVDVSLQLAAELPLLAQLPRQASAWLERAWRERAWREREDSQGLRLAYSVVVAQHQGQLHSESMLPQGATVVVRLTQTPSRPRAQGLVLSPMPSAASTYEVSAGCGATPHG